MPIGAGLHPTLPLRSRSRPGRMGRPSNARRKHVAHGIAIGSRPPAGIGPPERRRLVHRAARLWRTLISALSRTEGGLPTLTCAVVSRPIASVSHEPRSVRLDRPRRRRWRFAVACVSCPRRLAPRPLERRRGPGISAWGERRTEGAVALPRTASSRRLSRRRGESRGGGRGPFQTGQPAGVLTRGSVRRW
jgi:hypothetical protein